jgi:hypothetical protein
MATPIAWLLNLDADEELAAPVHYRPSQEVESRIAWLAEKMTLLLRPCDLILTHANASAALSLRALAFCPTPSASARLEAHGLKAPAGPALPVLRQANSRAFCAEVGQTLAGARYVRDMADLEDALRADSPTGDFVLKRPYGFAGRERRRAVQGVLDPSTLGFARKTFERGQGLQVEPWFERRGDFALHGFLLARGELLTGPLVKQSCDLMGRWRKSELAAPADLAQAHRESLLQELERAALALHAIGYHGPFGIDAFEYLGLGGALMFQPRSEINARFTMGYPRELLECALERQGVF